MCIRDRYKIYLSYNNNNEVLELPILPVSYTHLALIAKADKVTNNGFIAGNNAANAAGGVAIGNYAKVSGAGGDVYKRQN